MRRPRPCGACRALVTDGCPHWRPAETDRRLALSARKRALKAHQLRELERRGLMRVQRGRRKLLPILPPLSQKQKDALAVRAFNAWLARWARRSVE